MACDLAADHGQMFLAMFRIQIEVKFSVAGGDTCFDKILDH
jgi:hypothetical protein